MGTRKRKPTSDSEAPAVEMVELPERWSASRKTELVLRLLRGEALDAVSRESRVPAHELESWKGVFLEQGTRGLRIRGEPEERELTRFGNPRKRGSMPWPCSPSFGNVPYLALHENRQE